jgi:hypothetical protein
MGLQDALRTRFIEDWCNVLKTGEQSKPLVGPGLLAVSLCSWALAERTVDPFVGKVDPTPEPSLSLVILSNVRMRLSSGAYP